MQKHRYSDKYRPGCGDAGKQKICVELVFVECYSVDMHTAKVKKGKKASILKYHLSLPFVNNEEGNQTFFSCHPKELYANFFKRSLQHKASLSSLLPFASNVVVNFFMDSILSAAPE